MDRIERSKMEFKGLFGNVQSVIPEPDPELKEIMVRFIFGDVLCEGKLENKTRELLTLCIVSALGGCENQVKSHVQGNLNMGNYKNTLITAITHCLPLIGFPRTLNAISCINEVIN